MPNTAIVFDWDDTLLASTFLTKKGCITNLLILQEELIDELQKLEKSVHGILSLALSMGKVFIITNAESGWVEQSANIFLPSVSSLFDQITVISAQSDYKDIYPGNSLQWKIQAFQQHIKPWKHVISIGDSIIEREALKQVADEKSLAKSIKLSEQPTVEDLYEQIDMIIQKFPFLKDYSGNLDLMTTVT